MVKLRGIGNSRRVKEGKMSIGKRVGIRKKLSRKDVADEVKLRSDLIERKLSPLYYVVTHKEDKREIKEEMERFLSTRDEDINSALMYLLNQAKVGQIKDLEKRARFLIVHGADYNRASGHISHLISKNIISKNFYETAHQSKEVIKKKIKYKLESYTKNVDQDISEISILGRRVIVTLTNENQEVEISKYAALLRDDSLKKENIDTVSLFNDDVQVSYLSNKRKYFIKGDSFTMDLTWYVSGKKHTVKIDVDSYGVTLSSVGEGFSNSFKECLEKSKDINALLEANQDIEHILSKNDCLIECLQIGEELSLLEAIKRGKIKSKNDLNAMEFKKSNDLEPEKQKDILGSREVLNIPASDTDSENSGNGEHDNNRENGSATGHQLNQIQTNMSKVYATASSQTDNQEEHGKEEERTSNVQINTETHVGKGYKSLKTIVDTNVQSDLDDGKVLTSDVSVQTDNDVQKSDTGSQTDNQEKHSDNKEKGHIFNVQINTETHIGEEGRLSRNTVDKEVQVDLHYKKSNESEFSYGDNRSYLSGDETQISYLNDDKLQSGISDKVSVDGSEVDCDESGYEADDEEDRFKSQFLGFSNTECEFSGGYNNYGYESYDEGNKTLRQKTDEEIYGQREQTVSRLEAQGWRNKNCYAPLSIEIGYEVGDSQSDSSKSPADNSYEFDFSSDTESEFSDLDDQFDVLEDKSTSVNFGAQKIADLSKLLSDKEECLVMLTKQKDSLLGRVKKLHMEKKELAETNKEISLYGEKLNVEKIKLLNQYKKLEAAFNHIELKYKQELDNVQREKEAQQQEIGKLKDENEGLQEKLQQKDDKQQTKEQTLEAELQQEKQVTQDLKDQLRESSNSKEKTIIENEDLKEKIRILEDDLRAVYKKYTALGVELRESKKKYDGLQKEIAELFKEYETVVDGNKKQKIECEKQLELIDGLHKKYYNLEEAHTKLLEKYEVLVKEYEEQKTEYEKQQELVIELGNKMEIMSNELKNRDQEMIKLRQENQELLDEKDEYERGMVKARAELLPLKRKLYEVCNVEDINRQEYMSSKELDLNGNEVFSSENMEENVWTNNQNNNQVFSCKNKEEVDKWKEDTRRDIQHIMDDMGSTGKLDDMAIGALQMSLDTRSTQIDQCHTICKIKKAIKNFISNYTNVMSVQAIESELKKCLQLCIPSGVLGEISNVLPFETSHVKGQSHLGK